MITHRIHRASWTSLLLSLSLAAVLHSAYVDDSTLALASPGMGVARTELESSSDVSIGTVVNGATRSSHAMLSGVMPIAFSTFLGDYEPPLTIGSNGCNDIAVDDDGYIYVTGWAGDSRLFLKNPLRAQVSSGFDDAFVLKLTPDGSSVVFGTLLGGDRLDGASGIAVDASHNIYVVGYTDSVDFPTTGGHELSCNGDLDAFVIKISANGDRILYSRCLGGGSSDIASSVAVDSAGHAYVAGTTASEDFPTRRPVQMHKAGGALDEDAFVTKLGASGDIVYSTYLGGSHSDYANGIALAEDQSVVVVGASDSIDFPTRNAIQPGNSGGGRPYVQDAFVTSMASSGDSIGFSTYLGGTENDSARGVAIDGKGRIIVVGSTTSPDFPVRQAVQANLRGSSDAFVARLARNGTEIDRATFLGGSGAGTELALDVSVPPDGRVLVLGLTNTGDFPTRTATQGVYNGSGELFVTRYVASMSDIEFSTYLGGTGTEPVLGAGSSFSPLSGAAASSGLAVDASGSVVLAADTTSPDFPLKAALGPRFTGTVAAVVVKLAAVEPPTMSDPRACTFVTGRVPTAVVSSALAQPERVVGWNMLCRPNVPASRFNTLRTWLSLLNISSPYHPLYNPVVFKCGCP